MRRKILCGRSVQTSLSLVQRSLWSTFGGSIFFRRWNEMDFLPRWLHRRPYIEVDDFGNKSGLGQRAPLLGRNGSPNNNWRSTAIVDRDDDDTKTKTTNAPGRSSRPRRAQSIDDTGHGNSASNTSRTRPRFPSDPDEAPLVHRDRQRVQHQRRSVTTSGQRDDGSKMVNRQIAPLSVFTVQDVNRPKDLDNGADFEKAIKLCGYGKFHYGFVLLCGMMFLCVGCQNGVNAYILPSAECDLRLSSEEKGLLNVAFLVGGVVSSIFWGIFADAYGRKNILVGTLLIDGLLTLVSSFSQSFQVLLAFRAVSGFMIGAPGSLIYTYLGEFHAAKQRVKSICYVGFFWTLSWLILPGLAWIIIPMRIKWEYDGFLYNSWRLYLAVIGLPTLLIAAILTQYPESPKFLLSQGKCDEALEILRDVYASNVGRDRSEYPVKFLSPLEEGEECEKKPKSSHKENGIRRTSLVTVGNFGDTCNERRQGGDRDLEQDSIRPSLAFNLLGNVYQQMRSLASPPIFKWAILCWTIYFTNMFGYYGLGLWFPELFNRFENYYKMHPNVSVSVCELVSSANNTVSLDDSVSLAHHMDCDKISIDERVFVNTLTINGVCLLGNVASGYFADRVGRRTIPVTTSLLAGLAGFAIYFVRSSAQNLIVACIYSLTITTANFVIGSVVVDIFPTRIAAVAVCMMTLFGRIGAIASNLAFGMLLDISCEVPIFLVGTIVVLGGLLALLLPPTKR